jgi:hypothetical protein
MSWRIRVLETWCKIPLGFCVKSRKEVGALRSSDGLILLCLFIRLHHVSEISGVGCTSKILQVHEPREDADKGLDGRRSAISFANPPPPPWPTEKKTARPPIGVSVTGGPMVQVYKLYMLR